MHQSYFFLCNEHPNKVISDVCLTPDCTRKLICQKCRPTHEVLHSSSIIPIFQILYEDSTGKKKSPESLYNSFEDFVVLEVSQLKREINQKLDDLVSQYKGKFSKSTQRRQFRKKSKQEKREMDIEEINSRDYLKDYINSYSFLKQEMDSTDQAKIHLKERVTKFQVQFKSFVEEIPRFF